MSKLDAVTGAFGYTGKYITAGLLANGRKVITITGHLKRKDPFDGQVQVFPFDFHRPEQLTATLRGVDTLYNTYWVRFEHGGVTFAQAVENSKTLFRAAAEAGVRRIVHVSIANPTGAGAENLPYYRGKAELEEALQATGVSYAILRPTVVFSLEDILINNIAWLVKRLPVFAVPGTGNYQLQPIFVEDLADIAVNAGQSEQNMIIDAVGPEKYTFSELVKLIAETNNKQSGNPKLFSTKIIHVPPAWALFCARILSLVIGDVVLTKNELEGLSANLLVSGQSPTGKTGFRQWLIDNIDALGNRYASEVKRHYGAMDK